MNFKSLLAILAIVPLLAACAHSATHTAGEKDAAVSPTPQIMCTQDARQCPDGSWVGRSSPKCEFKCPAAR